MSIVDIFILAVLVSFAIIGFRRGVINSLVAFVGFILVVCLSYLFKDILGDFFVLNLPFIKFSIVAGGSVVLNIVMYQMIAFIILLIIFGIIYKILLAITGFVEKILKITIILGIPSKILGLVVGLLEGYIIVYLLLFFAVQPYVSIGILDSSKYASTILNQTPILSDFSEKTLVIINEVHDTIKNKDDDDFDLKLTDLILKEKVASPELIQELVDSQKIKVDGIEKVINKYKKAEWNND